MQPFESSPAKPAACPVCGSTAIEPTISYKRPVDDHMRVPYKSVYRCGGGHTFIAPDPRTPGDC